MTDEADVAQHFWDSLGAAQRAEMLSSERPSSEVLSKMSAAGLLFISEGKWETDQRPGYAFVYPPALLEIMERVRDEEVILEGGDRNGQPAPFSAMTHDGVGNYVLHDKAGVYRHDEDSPADFRDGQRVAVFEPGPHLRLADEAH